MADDSQTKGTADGAAKHESRLVFVSHTHADRELALALKGLIDTAFSGIVTGYTSSDPGPTGGITPGKEWYSQIESRLREAEAVWVLATPASITRPWIYWEAGAGKALCPHGVVVVRVNLKTAEVPSPLNNFQSYDGVRDNEIIELLGKVAAQVKMNLAKVLTDDCARTWLSSVQKYEPLQEDSSQAPELTPERLDRLDAAITRLESMGTTPQLRSTRTLPRRVITPADLVDPEEEVFGDAEQEYTSFSRLLRVIETAPEDSELEVDRIDNDGDLLILGRRGPHAGTVWLTKSALGEIDPNRAKTARAVRLFKRAVALRDSTK